MAKVFISYRRADSGGFAGRLYDHVMEKSADSEVFRDVNKIPLGSHFEDEIEAAMAECDLLLAVIGPRFLDQVNGPRLHDEADHLRRELAAALRSARTRVVPVLVDGAEVPRSADLPAELAALATRQAFDLRDGRFESDVDVMLRQLGLVSPRTFRWGLAAAAVILVAGLALAALLLTRGTEETVGPGTGTTPTAVVTPTDGPVTRGQGPVVLGVFPPDDPAEVFDADTFVDSQPVRESVRFRVLAQGDELSYQWFSSLDGTIGSEADFFATLTGACFGRTHEITVLVRDGNNQLAEAKTHVVVRSALLAEGVICPLVPLPRFDLEVLDAVDAVALLQRDEPELFAQLTATELVTTATSQLGEDSALVLSSIYAQNTTMAEAQVMLIDPTLLQGTTVFGLVDDVRTGQN